ncbi:hypothetical protein ACEWY4_003836 [Coilia grayii]|uniref:Integrase core domain-containing protein n=1 Tax=Coilia grayii TaxID=363190 RepID=A0ABD1KSF4_9TELE
MNWTVQSTLRLIKKKTIALSTHQGARGRPKILISNEQISSLLKLSFPVPAIADLLGISIRTVRRRMEEFSLSVRASYSNLSDEQLDGIVSEIKNRIPHAGYRMMKGALEAEGHKVPWDRIRGSMHRVDTLGVYSRMINLGCVVRRSPRFLMHIDTNHKLIRYNMVIFGGIDGCSRKVRQLAVCPDFHHCPFSFSLATCCTTSTLPDEFILRDLICVLWKWVGKKGRAFGGHMGTFERKEIQD